MHSELILLQGKVKEDPDIYRDDAMKYFKHFLTQYEIFQLKPSKDHKEFSSLVKFLSSIASCYPDDLHEFPSQIAGLLEQNSLILEPSLRMTLVRALILLRNKNLLSPTRYVVLILFFHYQIVF
jgi:protein SDA1